MSYKKRKKMSHYYKISVKVNSHKKTSYFLGSALRGAFGHALKEKSCINPSYKCDGCFVRDRCLYYEFYEVSSGYRPFRFDVTMNQQSYDFGLMLFFSEPREEDVSVVMEALSLMLTKYGLEREHTFFPKSRFDVERVYPLNPIVRPKKFDVVSLVSLTPFILKQSNRKLIKEITLEDILSSLYKRRAFFEEGKAHAKLSFAPSYKLLSSKSNYQKTFRRSDAQGKKIPVEGYSVELMVKELDDKSYALLKYGETVAVGNDTVRGYGRFLVEFGVDMY
jgi:hypothetical protein